MTALTIRLDDHTSKQLEALSRTEGIGTGDLAARLLRRAVIDARPRRHFSADAVQRANAPFEAKDVILAESDSESRTASLKAEDVA